MLGKHGINRIQFMCIMKRSLKLRLVIRRPALIIRCYSPALIASSFPKIYKREGTKDPGKPTDNSCGGISTTIGIRGRHGRAHSQGWRHRRTFSRRLSWLGGFLRKKKHKGQVKSDLS